MADAQPAGHAGDAGRGGLISRRTLLLGGVGLALPMPVAAQRRPPRCAISVIVDLSETWHNRAAQRLNLALLVSVGNAIVAAAPRLPRPLVVRHHGIGAASLGQQALCSTLYQRSIFGRRRAGIVTNENDFRRYLVSECPRMVLFRRPEPLTEITAAIVSAVRASAMGGAATARLLIMLSDFKEETPTPYSLRSVDLRGARVLLLYRTLPEDRRDPRGLERRIALWRGRLASRGAAVQAFDENAALSGPDLVTLIVGRR